MKIFYKGILYYIVGLLAVIAVISYWFYPFDRFFYFWDQQAVIRYTFENFSRVLFSWNYFTVAPGSSNPVSITFSYFMGMNVLFGHLWGSVLGQYSYVLLTFAIGYTGIFFLLHYLAAIFSFKENKILTHTAILFVSFFYLFNIFNSLFAIGDFSMYMLFFMFLPTTLIFFLLSMNKVKYYPIFCLAVILQSQSIAQPSYFLNLLIYLALFSVLLLTKFNLVKVIRHYIICVFLIIPLLAFYFFPLVSIGSYTLKADLNAIGGAFYLDYYRNFSTPLQTITFNNFRLLSLQGYQYIGWWVKFFYDNKFFEIISALFFVGILFVNIKQTSSKYKYVSVINIILLFLSIFICSLPYIIFTPFRIIWVKFPVIQILRGWDQQMDHYYLYILLLVSFLTIFVAKKRITRIIILISFILLYGIYSFPAVTGSFFYNTHFQIKNNPYGKGISQKVKLPEEYLNLNKTFQHEQFARILIYPWDQLLDSDFFNGNEGYAGAHLFSELTSKETISAGGGDIYYQSLIVNTVYNDPYSEQTINNIKKFDFTDILVRKKYNNNPSFIYKDIDVSQLEKTLDTISRKVLSTKYFDVYHLQDLPIIQGKNITFQEINPTSFKILISHLKGKENLLFLEAYYPQWKIFPEVYTSVNWCTSPKVFSTLTTMQCTYHLSPIDGSELHFMFEKPLFDNSHAVFNSYANMWTIDSSVIKKLPGSYYKINPDGTIDAEFVLYFRPQISIYEGVFISLGTFFIVTCSIYGYLLYKKVQNHD